MQRTQEWGTLSGDGPLAKTKAGPPVRRMRNTNTPKSMHATATHFVRLFPDWNSLDSVRHAHSFLEAVALVFFALLVFFDVLAHFSEDKKRERLLEKIGLCFFAVAVFAEIGAYPYGQRNDTLSEQIIGSLDAKSREAAGNASTALTKADEADTKAGVANDKSGKAQDTANAANRTSGLAQAKAEAVDKLAVDLDARLAKAAQAQLVLKQHVEQVASDREVIGNRGDRTGQESEKRERKKRFDEVRKYAGTLAVIQPVSDGEPSKVSAEIGLALNDAGWRVVYTDEGHSSIPPDLPEGGVKLVTLEESPFDPDPKSKTPIKFIPPSQAANAAMAAVALLELDLGPPFGPLFWGVHWEEELDKKEFAVVTRRGFVFPRGAVVIVVGTKPADTSWPGFSPTQYPTQKKR